MAALYGVSIKLWQEFCINNVAQTIVGGAVFITI
jgi:hypothetical protein